MVVGVSCKKIEYCLSEQSNDFTLGNIDLPCCLEKIFITFRQRIDSGKGLYMDLIFAFPVEPFCQEMPSPFYLQQL